MRCSENQWLNLSLHICVWSPLLQQWVVIADSGGVSSRLVHDFRHGKHSKKSGPLHKCHLSHLIADITLNLLFSKDIFILSTIHLSYCNAFCQCQNHAQANCVVDVLTCWRPFYMLFSMQTSPKYMAR